MRAFILVAGAALALAACRGNNQSESSTNVGGDLTAENIVSNDVTAIDAVTGDASNMAADVNYMNAEDNSVANLATGGTSAKPTTKPRPKAHAAENTTTNSNATANTAE